ncbi:MAG: phosphoglucomutase, alpha-D-glucose phosphate-specific [Deltaproteobacteria bacterium]|nr:phosphoglucomutase, alpha-D-glucose phosphate-specific [Deltaproteobacteria bacterium]
MSVHPLAGLMAPVEQRVNLPRLLADYYTAPAAAPVAFGTSGHRGSASAGSFNEAHVAAVTAAVAEYRRNHGGPLFLGFDTHALSEAAFRTALEVLAAHDVPVIIHEGDEYTPTPVISFLIVEHNRGRPEALADGLILTPSHNPPMDGGIKYNPPHGGPAEDKVTGWIEKRANELLRNPGDIPRRPFARARSAARAADFIRPFARALGGVVDLAAVKSAGLKLAADPMGGSGVHFWGPIAEEWGLDITVVNPGVDSAFAFMPLDSDGVIRMDCSSPYAMAGLLGRGGDFDLAFGNDPDFDRHGIVSGGELMNPNHYLAVAVDYLLAHRPDWPRAGRVGKTMVSSTILDRVVAAGGRELYETPVGFKWFVEGLASGALLFGGEESAGASLLQRDGRTWTTDKDGFALALLAAEIMGRTGRAPHELYQGLAERHGASCYGRLDTAVTDREKAALKSADPGRFKGAALAGLAVTSAANAAPGNGAPLGGLKVTLADGSWFALRPSGTEPKLKLYVESFSGPEIWDKIVREAPELVFEAI